MSLISLIAPEVPALHTSDSCERALQMMEQCHLTDLPLISSEEQFLCLIRESDLLNAEDPDSLLVANPFVSYKPSLPVGCHPFEALTYSQQWQLQVIPVVDNENKYIGSLTHQSLVQYMYKYSALNNPGGIIVLEIKPNNYSLCQIARICENEDVTIMHSQLAATEAGMLEVTLKTNRMHLAALASSFERHEYNVTFVFGDKQDSEDLLAKYHLLMNYLNM